MLTTPIDTGIVKANIEETVIDTSGKVGVVTLTENTIKCGTPSEDKFNKFKIGDMISVVISVIQLVTELLEMEQGVVVKNSLEILKQLLHPLKHLSTKLQPWILKHILLFSHLILQTKMVKQPHQ